jgi:hypothetical protein
MQEQYDQQINKDNVNAKRYANEMIRLPAFRTARLIITVALPFL